MDEGQAGHYRSISTGKELTMAGFEDVAKADAAKAESYISAHWHSWGGGIAIGLLAGYLLHWL